MGFEDDILNAVSALKTGGIILYPTDTIWGLGCDAMNAIAVEKIYALKKRPDEKSLIVLVADEKEIPKYVAKPGAGIFDYLRTLQKPTTVVYEGAMGLANNLLAKDGTVAIRICKDEFCKQLIKKFGGPIVSTSANISGDPFPENFGEIAGEIKEGVDYVVRYRQQDNNVVLPSTVVKWSDGKPVILRP